MRALRRVLFASMAVLVICVARPQAIPSPSPSVGTMTAQTACPDALTLNSLESNAGVLKAAQDLAAQMVGRYNADNKNPPSLGKGQWGPFHAAILAAALPSCVETKVASAKATTGQTNKQNGAPSTSDGSTSAAQKVGIPELLGIAVESGAITNSVTGTTMTLSTTPYGFFAAFGKDTESNYRRFQFYTQVGVSATFNVATTTNSLASATRKQVSEWQTKLTFRDTSTRSLAVKDIYEKKGGLGEKATLVAADLSDSPLVAPADKLEKPAEAAYVKAWSSSLQQLVSQAPEAGDTNQSQKQLGIAKQLLALFDKDSEYQKALSDALNDLKNNSPSGLPTLLARLVKDNASYASAETEFEKDVQDLTRGWNGDVTFGQKYPTTTTTATTASGGPSTTTPSIPAYLFGELDVTCEPKTVDSQRIPCLPLGNGTFTGNFSGDFYTNPNPSLNEKSFRGAIAALQAQWSLGPGFVRVKSPNDNSKMTLSVSGNYQRLQENKDQKGKRPDIVLGNLKLEIPISSGVSFPLSISIANATEQIKETYVKGNFGISFDLDKLAALLKAQ